MKAAYVVTLALFVAAPGQAQPDYTLGSGDVIDVSVFRVPELSRQVVVDFADRIAFPPLGRIDVAGRTLDEVALTISDQLASREVLLDAEVTVGLVEARPIFVGGDVTEPGSFPYQNDLSVRRAVALAGGIGLARSGGGLEEAARLMGERGVLAQELLRLEAAVARLTAEIERREGTGLSEGGRMPRALGELEERELGSNLEEDREQVAFLGRITELAQEQIKLLSQQQVTQNNIIETQREEVSRVKDIQERGLTVQRRLVDELRALATMEERAGNTAADLAAARQRRMEAQHELDRFDARRKAELEVELKDVMYDIANISAELQAVNTRLAQLGFAEEENAEFWLHRFEKGREKSERVDDGTVLRPGDMLEVVVNARGGAGLGDILDGLASGSASN